VEAIAMAAGRAARDHARASLGSGAPLEERLERGEVVYFERCPFALPEGDDHQFLLAQEHSRWGHKNICYNPHTHRVTGFRRHSADQPARLRQLLAAFSHAATAWLAGILPGYARAWQLDRASLRPEEEATRRLRLNARNDLLHVDSFPTRPANGRRILRLFVNLNPSEPRVWVTSEGIAPLLVRFGKEIGLPRAGGGRTERGWGYLCSLLFPFLRGDRSTYDGYMRRLHDYLKFDDDFQERSPKRFWHFAPGSAWLAFTDGLAHAVARGRHALEHSYFVAPQTLALPDLAPAALLFRPASAPLLRKAA
jgi:hypothetical protein